MHIREHQQRARQQGQRRRQAHLRCTVHAYTSDEAFFRGFSGSNGMPSRSSTSSMTGFTVSNLYRLGNDEKGGRRAEG